MVEKCLYYGQVREPGQQNKDKVSPCISELLQLEELAKQEGLGRWSKVGVSFTISLNLVCRSAFITEDRLVGQRSNSLNHLGIILSNINSK